MDANRHNGAKGSEGGKPPGDCITAKERDGECASANALIDAPVAAPILPSQPVQCALRPRRALLLWDGQCDFCARWAKRIKRLAGERIDCQPYQQRLGDFPEITTESFDSALFLILPDGRAYHSAQAVYRALALRRPMGIVLWLYRRCPHFARFSDRRYRAIAAGRRCAS